MSEAAVFETDIANLELIGRGKVRDIYAIDDRHMLIVTTDRFSAFDVVFDTPIPHKGELLTEVSNFWFARTASIIRNHLTDLDPRDYLVAEDYRRLHKRAIIVRRLQPLPVEAIVRGYVIGSGWKDYQASGAICGIELPRGLAQAAQLLDSVERKTSTMACPFCEQDIRVEALKCHHCGQYLVEDDIQPRKLMRSRNKVLAGVCGGLAEYADMDPSLVRILTVVIAFFSGIIAGLLIYLVAALIIPESDA